MNGLLFLIFSCLLLLFFIKVSIETEILRDTKPLDSLGDTFRLGFFKPGNSNNWYLGIWYKNIPNKTVIWVANVDTPLSAPLGLLKIDDDGKLVLLNQNKSIIWSSSNNSLEKKPIAHEFLKSGNLVLRYVGDNSQESYIWQSFDYPTNTFFEGLKLGYKIPGMDRHLTSWKSPDDPSPGKFTLGIDSARLPQLVLSEGLSKKYRAGPWNGRRFSGIPELDSNSIFKPIFVSNDKEVYYSFQDIDSSIISVVVLSPEGFAQRFIWNYRQKVWKDVLTLHKDHCDDYGYCGPYGICNINKNPICRCLEGFVPKSPQDWEQFERSGGCVRKISLLDCNNGDEFELFSSVKLPDTNDSWVDETMSLKECEVHCLNSCSCMAYANSNITEGSGCVLWFGDLLDIKEFTQDGQDLYVRMAPSEQDGHVHSRKKEKLVAVIIFVSIVTGILLLGLTIGCTIWKTRTKQTENRQNQDYTRENPRGALELPIFDFATIAAATNNFSHDNKLGEGGFGPVYKGELLIGQEIAVKRLSKNSGQGLNEFKNEVILISKLQHRNLVRLLGCCIERDEKMLIYEYMPNKSLDFFIFDQARYTLLGWQKRFDIIVGIAQGLLYLHRDSRLRIVHRDLKAGNILLDSEMNPKISDFGMARTFGGNQIEAVTGRVVGTYGYMSPEYAIDGLFSMKSDVFSFGVLVLEIVSGKKNRGFDHPDHGLNLLGHAWKLWNEGKALDMMDTLLEYRLPEPELLRCIQVGLLCVQQSPEDRPSMSSVVLMLGSEASILPQPKQPGFYNERSFIEAHPSSSSGIQCTTEVTISWSIGR